MTQGQHPWAGCKACGRAGDHRSGIYFRGPLAGCTAGELAVGDDVEFAVRHEPGRGLVAPAVARATSGSAVFEQVGEEELCGVVLERPQPLGRSGYASGLLQYAGADGAPARLPFGADDLQGWETLGGAGQAASAGQNLGQGAGQGGGARAAAPKPGDQVMFRIASRAQTTAAAARLGGIVARVAGRRAVQVTV